MNPMMETFIAESRELLESASRCFLALEKTPDDKALFNDLFRSVHTIKGSSGIFDITPLTSVVHAAEDVLDCVKEGDITLNPDHIDLFLDCLDQVNHWLDDLEHDEVLPSGAAELGAELSQRLRTLIAGVKTESDITSGEPARADESGQDNFATPPLWLALIPSAKRREMLQQALAGSVTFATYQPDPDCYFNGQDPLHEILTLPGLLWFHAQPLEPWPDSGEFDPFRNNLVFYVAISGDKAAIFDHFYHVAEQINAFYLSPLSLVFPAGQVAENDQTIDSKNFMEQTRELAQQQDWPELSRAAEQYSNNLEAGSLAADAAEWLIALIAGPCKPPGLIESLLSAMAGAVFAYDPDNNLDETDQAQQTPTNGQASNSAEVTDDIPQQIESSVTEADDLASTQSTEAVKALLKFQLAALKMPIEGDLWQGRFTAAATVVKRLAQGAELPVTEAQIDEAYETAIKNMSGEALRDVIEASLAFLAGNSVSEISEGGGPEAAFEPLETVASDIGTRSKRTRSMPKDENGNVIDRRGQNKVLRVDQHRIDALMDLVGELVVAKNALPFLAKKAEQIFNSRELSREIREQYAVINRLAEEMQGAVMQVRMVPVGSVFQRFPRLIRDLSRKLDKKIRLDLIGEETEADKTVVEDLADPLIHLIRNSIDHGIETKEQRLASGKPEEACIQLKATQLDDQVIIEIIDDGKGIDANIIKAKALEKGVLDQESFEQISDHEALQLIFEAGFSTVEKVSDLSGRGVGMDVVRTTIANAGGSVNVQSTVGEGTTVTLSLPLSMAITQVMMIECAGQSYGVPFDAIAETVRVEADSVSQIKHRGTIVLRDRIIPLYNLRAMLSLPEGENHTELAVLIMHVYGQQIGLIIDDFQEGIDVITKPLEGVMACYTIYSGAALLGDGRVLMVLNLGEIMKCQSN